MIFTGGYGIIDEMRDEKGRFLKGINYWLGKKRAGFITSTSFKKGEHPSPNTEFKKGCIPWNKNPILKICEICNKEFEVNKFRENIARFCSIKCKSTWFGLKHSQENNSIWKGDDVGYRGLHDWVRRQLGRPTKCEYCGKDNLTKHKIHWANKSHKYKRDVTDWIRLCAKCHKKEHKGGN